MTSLLLLRISSGRRIVTIVTAGRCFSGGETAQESDRFDPG
jgi:hypothetical protein